MSVSTDPLSALYDALWALLEAHAGLTALVRANNRIKFSGASRDPLKAEIATADLPELRLIVSTVTPKIIKSSNSGTLVMGFDVEVAAGEQRLTEAGSSGIGSGLLPVVWETLRALHGWQAALTQVTWPGGTIKIMRLDTATAQIGVSDADLNRGIKGWSTVWACEVEFSFLTADMQPT